MSADRRHDPSSLVRRLALATAITILIAAAFFLLLVHKIDAAFGGRTPWLRTDAAIWAAVVFGATAAMLAGVGGVATLVTMRRRRIWRGHEGVGLVSIIAVVIAFFAAFVIAFFAAVLIVPAS